jgi:hypothetical protein
VGGLITKLILVESGLVVLDRPTIDIDANWVGAPPSMAELVSTVNGPRRLIKKVLETYSLPQNRNVLEN